MEPTTEQSSLAIPIAIISGFAMIALAIFFTGNNNQNEEEVKAPIKTNQGELATGKPRPVDTSDYIKGNPNAPILMIEYSDYDCPFCKKYHETMNRIMNEYGVTGKVAWVYRQLPLVKLHPASPKISEAALCVGEIGGNNAFWKFSDTVFETRNPDDMTNLTKLPEYAELAGVKKEDYDDCMNSGRMEERVLSSIKDGLDSGARGTPYTVLVVGDQQAVISGAQPYETVNGIIKNLVDQLNNTVNTTEAGE